MSVMVPGSGELLDLSEMATDEIAGQIEFFAEMARQCSAFRRVASDELAERLDHEGRRSADVGEWHVEVNAPTEKVWDVERLIDTLDRFVGEGALSSRKAAACIRRKPEVLWNEVKTLLSDPRLAPEISLCYENRPATRSLKVRRV